MKYVFTQEQFITLLTLTGRKKWYTFCQEENMEGQALIHVIADLYRAGCVTELEGKLVLSDPMGEMFNKMRCLEYVVELTFTEKEAACHLVYIAGHGRGIILERDSVFCGPAMKLWEDEVVYYVHDLNEKGMLPESLLTERAEAEAIEEMAWKEYPAEYGEQELLLRVRRIRTEDGETDNTLEVFRTIAFQWVHVAGSGAEYYHVYSKEEICGLLIKELKGAEI